MTRPFAAPTLCATLGAFGLGLALTLGTAGQATAGARVSVTVGDDCCWGPPHHTGYYHHPHHPHWGRPVYVVPPPVIYEPPPVVVVPRRPAVVYAPPPPQPVEAMPASPVYQNSAGQTCREYQLTVHVGGTSQPAYGTACLQPDGTWRIVR